MKYNCILKNLKKTFQIEFIFLSLFLLIIYNANAQDFWTKLETPNESLVFELLKNNSEVLFIGTPNGLFFISK